MARYPPSRRVAETKRWGSGTPLNPAAREGPADSGLAWLNVLVFPLTTLFFSVGFGIGAHGEPGEGLVSPLRASFVRGLQRSRPPATLHRRSNLKISR